MRRGSFSSLSATSDVGCQLFNFDFLKFIGFDLPVVVLVEESENCSGIRELFLESSVGDVVLSPVDDVVVVQIISVHHLFLDMGLLEVLQVVGSCEAFNVSNTGLKGIDD